MRLQFWSSTTTDCTRRRALPSIIASALFGTTLIAIGVGSAPSLAGGAPVDPVVTVVTAGKTHTCAVVDGSAYCWGSNGEYQLGNGVEYFYDYVEKTTSKTSMGAMNQRRSRSRTTRLTATTSTPTSDSFPLRSKTTATPRRAL